MKNTEIDVPNEEDEYADEAGEPDFLHLELLHFRQERQLVHEPGHGRSVPVAVSGGKKWCAKVRENSCWEFTCIQGVL